MTSCRRGIYLGLTNEELEDVLTVGPYKQKRNYTQLR